jgi:outer membrane usher protein FimD/PapC
VSRVGKAFCVLLAGLAADAAHAHAPDSNGVEPLAGSRGVAGSPPPELSGRSSGRSGSLVQGLMEVLSEPAGMSGRLQKAVMASATLPPIMASGTQPSFSKAAIPDDEPVVRQSPQTIVLSQTPDDAQAHADHDSLKKFQSIPLSRPRTAQADYNELWNNGFSARANLSLIVEESSFAFDNTRGNSQSALLIAEPYLRLGFLGNVSLESRLVQRHTRDKEVDAGITYSGNKEYFVRDYTRVVADFPDLPLRLQIGDVQNRGLSLQRFTNLLGVSLSSANTELQPLRSSFASGSHSFTLASDALVEVMVNGRQEGQLFLAAGEYNLSDIPLRYGANDVELSIRDASGRREKLALSLFGSPQLLDAGEVSYTVSGGIQAVRTSRGLDYFEDRFIVAGLAGVGLTSQAQVSGSFVSVNSNHAVSAGVQLSDWIGEFGAELFGQTGDTVKNAIAAKASFRTIASQGAPELRAAAVYFGPGYDALGSIDEFSRPLSESISRRFSRERRWEIEVESSLELPNDFVWDVGFDAVQYKTGPDDTFTSPEWSFYSSLLGPLGETGLVSGTLSVGQFDDGPLDIGAFISFSMRLGNKSRARLSHNTYNDRTRAIWEWDERRPLNNIRGSIGIERSSEFDEPETNLVAELEIDGERGNFYAETSSPTLGASDEVQQRYSVAEVSTSIGYAGGAFAVGRPSNGPFAIISSDESMGDAVILTEFDGDDYYSARATQFETLLYGEMLPYRDQTIAISAIDGSGALICEALVDAFPSNKSGKRVVVSRDPRRSEEVTADVIIAFCGAHEAGSQTHSLKTQKQGSPQPSHSVGSATSKDPSP